MTLLKKLLGEVPMTYNGGGKGGVTAAAPIVNPTPPVEEASIEIDDDEIMDDKLKTSKDSLKIPLANAKDTGLKL